MKRGTCVPVSPLPLPSCAAWETSLDLLEPLSPQELDGRKEIPLPISQGGVRLRGGDGWAGGFMVCEGPWVHVRGPPSLYQGHLAKAH